jgi:peroxiredoxin
MKDISFKIFHNDEIQEIKAVDLFAGKKLLICSIKYIMGKGVPNVYLKHLNELKLKYKKYGVDEIYVVNSSDQIFFLPKVTAFFPNLIPLLDQDKKFYFFLVNKFNLDEKKFNNIPYQLLISNNKIEKIYYTDSENNFKNYDLLRKLMHYVKSTLVKKKIKKIELKNYKNVRQKLLIEGINRFIIYLTDKKQLYYDYRDLGYMYDRAFYYYEIWPNEKLEEYLQIKN